MSTLQLFNFETNAVRVIEQEGEPWFVGKDICQILTIEKHHQALAELDDDERGTSYNIGTPCNNGNKQQMIIISEAGVFRLIFRSRKPEAERFKRWLAHDVSPQIRRTGRYLPQGETAGNAPSTTAPTPAAPPAADFATLFGEPLTTLQARISFIREARQIFGIPYARRLWQAAGLPTLEEGTSSKADDLNRQCLEHLLAATLKGTPVIHLIAEGETSSTSILARHGLRVLDDGGLAVATAAHMVAPFYRDTIWRGGGHIMPLLKCEGASRFKVMRFGTLASRTIYLPPELIDATSRQICEICQIQPASNQPPPLEAPA